MKDPEVAPLQLAVLSDPADHPHVESLVRALRGRGLQVGWDGDASIAPSWTDPFAAVQNARLVCVPVSRNSVAADRIVRALDTNFAPGRRSLALILDPSVRADVARRFPSWELVAFESLEALESVAGYLESTLAAFESQQSADAAPAESATQPHVVVGDSDASLDAPLSAELIQRLVAAASLSPSSQSNRFPVSFSRLFSALFYGGAWQQWCHAISQASGFDPSQLVPLAVTNDVPTFPLRASISAGRILESARGYAQRSNKPIDVPHVIAAYCFDPAGHERQLEAWSFDRVYWGNALVDEVARRFPEEASVFRALRDEAFPTSTFDANAPNVEHEQNVEGVAAAQTAGRPRYNAWNRPHIDNDRVGGAIAQDRDKLDVRKPALRFAKLLVAKDVAPPIALGLFGNWGSGKTFFMGLMRDRIDELSKTGGAQFVRGVAQIEFNAWHYHDTNLWASLALRIFEGLAEKLGGKRESDVERKRKELHQQINSSAARRSEADALRTSALERRAVASTELERLKVERDNLRSDSARLQREAAWKVVTRGAAFETLRKTAAELAAHFGIPAVYGSVEQVRKLKRDVEDTRAHAFGVLSAIGRRFHGVRDSAATIAVLLALLLSSLALGWGVGKLDEFRNLRLPAFSTTLVQVSALVTSVAAWCGRRVRELRVAIDTIGTVESELEAAENDVPPDAEALALEEQIAKLDQEIHRQSEEVNAAEREIAEATAEIDRINRGGLVYDFLQDRRAAANYVGQLGLISTIRQDFERLGMLLQDFAKNAPDGAPAIERIVLYVDDLDRCHPDKVVEVLQAVHLLLAFPLFNVVVGVDARWLERSLRRQYVGRSGGDRAQAEDPFSPQDYLEKIFQIPYALSRMDRNGFASLIGGMLETRSEWAAKQAAASAKSAGGKAQISTRGDAASEGAGEGAGEDAGKAAGEGAGEASTPDLSRNVLAAEKQPTSTKDESAAALYFEDHEQDFISTLYDFIDRPRLAKRFINIYRLLRVRADDEGESEEFLAPTTGAYRAALVLLAIHVGHPNVAVKFVLALQRSEPLETWTQLLTRAVDPRSATIACTARERAELLEVAAKLERCGAPAPMELDAYLEWAPRVACFSFDWHRPEAFAQRIAR